MTALVDLATAEAAGHAAAAAGDPVTTCPYAAQRTPEERALARAWVSAYLAERPPAADVVDYDDDGPDDVPEVARHLPGQHNQKTHGHRYHKPADRSSGLRKLASAAEKAANGAKPARRKAWHAGLTPDEVIKTRTFRTPANADVGKDPTVKRLARRYRKEPTARHRDAYLAAVAAVTDEHAERYAIERFTARPFHREEREAAFADPEVGAAYLRLREAFRDDNTASTPDDVPLTREQGDAHRAHLAEHDAIVRERSRELSAAFEGYRTRRRNPRRDDEDRDAWFNALPVVPRREHTERMVAAMLPTVRRRDETPDARTLRENREQLNRQVAVFEHRLTDYERRLAAPDTWRREGLVPTEEQRRLLDGELTHTRSNRDAVLEKLAELRPQLDAAVEVEIAYERANNDADRAELRIVVDALNATVGERGKGDAEGRAASTALRKELGIPSKTALNKLTRDADSATRQRGYLGESLLDTADKLARMRVILANHRREAEALNQRLAAGGLRQSTVDRLHEAHDQAESWIASELRSITDLEQQLAEARNRWTTETGA